MWFCVCVCVFQRQKGIESDEEEEEDAARGEVARGAPGELPPSDSESSSEDEEVNVSMQESSVTQVTLNYLKKKRKTKLMHI